MGSSGTTPGIGAGLIPKLPVFEQPAARSITIKPGSESGTIAHVNSDSPDTVFVDDPSRFDLPVLAHEMMHVIQNRNPGVTQVDAESPGAYNYGGIAGLRNLQAQGKTISSLNDEQQAELLRDYMGQMAAFKNSRDPKILAQADAMNKVYGPFIHQLANMAYPGGIDTRPQAPGPPPAELTGAIKPIEDVGGETINLGAGLIPKPKHKRK